MNTVEDARELLVLLEMSRQEAEAKLEASREAFRQSLKTIEETEGILQNHKKEILKARMELARQENLAEVAAMNDEVDADYERLQAKFEKIAQGKPWFEGTGNDDPIMPHQWQGAAFGAAARRFILGDGVGLGKTREAVAYMDLVGARKVLIVCEAGICNQFAGEVMELAPHRSLYNLYKKTPAKRHEMIDTIMSIKDAVVVVNFEIWRKDKDLLAKLLDWEIDTLIVDEAHNLKSTATANYKYINMIVACDNVCANCKGHIKGLYDPEKLREQPSRKVAVPCESCGWKIGNPTRVQHYNKLDQYLMTKSVKNVCLTTGTPILNDPTDIYSLLHLCNPVLFRNKAEFQKTYLTMNNFNGKWEWRGRSLDDLKPLIEGIFIARTVKDTGVVLPAQRVHVIPVELDPKLYPKQYRTIKQISETAEIILDSGESTTIMALIALITRKRQANVWPGGIKVTQKFTDEEGNVTEVVLFDAGIEIDESVKMDAILENIKELHEQGRRQLVYSQFTTGLAEFERRVAEAGIRVVRLDGSTPPALRNQIRTNFNRAMGEPPKWDVLLANYKTGGTGLNFTAATATHIMDEEWNPGKRNQSYGRTDRIGQTEANDVYVYRIPRSIDTWMSNTIKRKEAMIDGFNEVAIATSVTEDLRAALTNGDIL